MTDNRKSSEFIVLEQKLENLSDNVHSYRATVRNLERGLPDLIKSVFEPQLELQKKDIKIILLEALRDEVPTKQEHEELKEDYKKTRKTVWAAIVAAAAALGEAIMKHLSFTG